MLEADSSEARLLRRPPAVEWWGAGYMPAEIPVNHRLVTTLTGAFESVSGHPPRLRGMPFGADMHLLVRQGRTPALIFGPGDIRSAHAPDEFVPIAELETAVKVLATAILRFCRS